MLISSIFNTKENSWRGRKISRRSRLYDLSRHQSAHMSGMASAAFDEQMSIVARRDFSPFAWPPLQIKTNDPDNGKRVRQEFFAQARHEICLYTDDLSDDWTDEIADCITRNVALKIICATQPDPSAPLYQMITNHIDATRKGFFVTTTEDSRHVIANLCPDRQARSFAISDQSDYFEHTDFQEVTATFGKARNKQRPPAILKSFRHAAIASAALLGRKPHLSLRDFLDL